MISVIASSGGLPFSRWSTSAISSAAPAIARRNASSSSARAAYDSADQLREATRARSTAASTSAAVWIGTVPITSPVAGL